MDKSATFAERIGGIVEEHLKPRSTVETIKYCRIVTDICRDYWKKRSKRRENLENSQLTDLAEKALWCAFILDDLEVPIEQELIRLDKENGRVWKFDRIELSDRMLDLASRLYQIEHQFPKKGRGTPVVNIQKNRLGENCYRIYLERLPERGWRWATSCKEFMFAVLETAARQSETKVQMQELPESSMEEAYRRARKKTKEREVPRAQSK